MKKYLAIAAVTFLALAGTKHFMPKTTITDTTTSLFGSGVVNSSIAVCVPKMYPVPLLNQECTVTLSGNIEMPAAYAKLLGLLRDANYGDTVTILLAGNGGAVDGEDAIAQAIKDSKAHVITYAIGNVYSAHAYLTLAGDEIKLANNITLMFHRAAMEDGSTLKDGAALCAGQIGIDRGQDKHQKCLDYFNAQLKQEEVFLASMKHFFTDKQYQDILDGHDVYITSAELAKRI